MLIPTLTLVTIHMSELVTMDLTIVLDANIVCIPGLTQIPHG
jgi:hypothetical protein